ncbi:hypothetical protein CN918_29220 [Priestia megaterium]|nr:hypothetical protein CN918_29220 [Priestia megaterium]
MEKYTVNQIDDYQNKITKEQEKELIEHCNAHNISPDICAWYDDMKDFYQDWVYDNKIYKTKEEAYDRYKEGLETGEFKAFNNGEIVRLVL